MSPATSARLAHAAVLDVHDAGELLGQCDARLLVAGVQARGRHPSMLLLEAVERRQAHLGQVRSRMCTGAVPEQERLIPKRLQDIDKETSASDMQHPRSDATMQEVPARVGARPVEDGHVLGLGDLVKQAGRRVHRLRHHLPDCVQRLRHQHIHGLRLRAKAPAQPGHGLHHPQRGDAHRRRHAGGRHDGEIEHP
eukprot:5430239-Pyramimonas_sp.AAC.1